MYGRRLYALRLLALSLVAVAFGCQDQKLPSGPTGGAKAPPDPSAIISDGAHGGNPDFFFLPPMVPLPLGNPNFELGKFNNSLKASLKIEICELLPQNLNAQGLPTAATNCIAGAAKKTFAPGTVNLVNLPRRENGWWSLFSLPPDGFYYVLWDTRQSNLSVNKFYRIKVLLNGSDVPLGVADVDPMNSLFEWKFTRTGEVVQLIDDVLLPIPFRVEKGGGPALCGASNLCTSATITNQPEGSPDQIVQVIGSDGSAIAGVRIPAGFLPPPPGPQSVVLTIRGVNTGVNNLDEGTQQFPCHAGLHLQQFNSCFHFSTIPELAAIPGGEPGHEFDQFVRPITVGVCFVLHDTDHWQEPWVQLWSSDEEGANAKPLQSTSVAGILTGPSGETCGSVLLGSNTNDSNGLTRFASAGWQKVKSGFNRLFGVQTAYAVDFGIGGFAFDLSNIGPAMTARMRPGPGAPEASVEVGETTTLVARIVGTQKHDGSVLSTGISGLPIVFALGEESAAGLRLVGSEAPLSSQVTGLTNLGIIFPGSEGSGGGFVSANWTAPMTPGSYTVTATSPYAIGTITYNLTVRPASIGLSALDGFWANEDPETRGIVRLTISVEGNSASVRAFASCGDDECDWGFTNANTSGWATGQQITAFWDHGFATRTQTITYLSANRIRVVTFTDFTEADGRPDNTLTEFFDRTD